MKSIERSGLTSIHFSTVRYGGSVQHYYHFLLGLLVPLVNFISDSKNTSCFNEIVVRSCGPLDRILEELDLGLKIVSSDCHEAIFRELDPLLYRSVVLEGLDHEDSFDRSSFDKAGLFLRGLLASGVRRYHACASSSEPRILLINRDKPDTFYKSDASEAKMAGAQRRSIYNHDELETEIKSIFRNVLNTSLEGVALAEQIALFSWADIIIAQHGAALANLIWSHPFARIIEIVPRELEGRVLRRQQFGRLATCMGLTHEIFWQEGLHGPIEPHGLIDRIFANTHR